MYIVLIYQKEYTMEPRKLLLFLPLAALLSTVSVVSSDEQTAQEDQVECVAKESQEDGLFTRVYKRLDSEKQEELQNFQQDLNWIMQAAQNECQKLTDKYPDIVKEVKEELKSAGVLREEDDVSITFAGTLVPTPQADDVVEQTRNSAEDAEEQ